MRKLLIACMTMALVVPGMVSANLLTNPDFETGNGTGWTLSPNMTVAAENPENGDYAVKNWWDANLAQSVAVSPGQEVGLSGWAYFPNNNGAGSWGYYMNVAFVDSEGATIPGYEYNAMVGGVTYGAYTEYDTGAHVAPAGTVAANVNVGVWGSTPANPTYFDNFDLYAVVPEPTTGAMMGIAFAAICIAQKRRLQKA